MLESNEAYVAAASSAKIAEMTWLLPITAAWIPAKPDKLVTESALDNALKLLGTPWLA